VIVHLRHVYAYITIKFDQNDKTVTMQTIQYKTRRSKPRKWTVESISLWLRPLT